MRPVYEEHIQQPKLLTINKKKAVFREVIMNSFTDTYAKFNAEKLTENGAKTYRSSLSAVLDLFSLGGAYRSRSEAEVARLFNNAMDEDMVLATQCLFYLRDVRGGQGERRFFRTAFPILLKRLERVGKDDVKRRLIKLVGEYGRWDDLMLLAVDDEDVFNTIKGQFAADATAVARGESNISLLAKWMPSISTSSAGTMGLARVICKKLNMSHKEYRTLLSAMRSKLNVVEKLMSAGKWSEIVYEHVPSQAMLRYRKAFMKHDEVRFTAYMESVKAGETKVNTGTLYPHQLVEKVLSGETDVDVLWDNLPNYIPAGRKMMAVADISGSMYDGQKPRPISVSVALAVYCAEHNTGVFKDKFITFAERPQIIDMTNTRGVTTLRDKVQHVLNTDVGYSTNFNAVFDTFLRAATAPGVREEDIPDTLIAISDMEFNPNQGNVKFTNFEYIRDKFEDAGVKMPTLVFWNVAARNDTIPVLRSEVNTVLVSGFSPVTFKQVFQNKTPEEFMRDTLDAERYLAVKRCFG